MAVSFTPAGSTPKGSALLIPGAACACLVLATLAVWSGAAGGAPRAAARPAAAGSNGFAGYVPTSAEVKAHTTFTVPTATCAAGTTAVAPGVYINDTGSPDYLGAEVAIRCTPVSPTPTPTYTAIAYGKSGAAVCPPSQVTVAPGDRVSITVSVGGTATVDDLTTSTSASISGCLVGAGPPYVGMCSSPALTGPAAGLPDWCDAIGGATPICVPTYSTLRFDDVLVNGKPIGSLKPAALRVHMAAKPTRQITTGVLRSSGRAFRTTFVHC